MNAVEVAEEPQKRGVKAGRGEPLRHGAGQDRPARKLPFGLGFKQSRGRIRSKG